MRLVLFVGLVRDHWRNATRPRRCAVGVASAVAAIEGNVMEHGPVRRKPPTPNGREEGAFFAGSCRLADCHKMQGRDGEAAALL
jgi:hypothetical protein